MTITSNQTMEFHDLNPDKGIINIGSHPENDIVVQDPRVMPFHMMMDLRQKPYLVVSLNPEADIRVDGVPLIDSETTEVMDISQVSFSGYSLNLIQKNGGNSPAKIAVISPDFVGDTLPLPKNTNATLIAPMRSEPVKSVAVPLEQPIHYLPTSDVILVEVHEQKQIINVEQTAIYPLTIINGGSIVAAFDLQVEGVPREWVKITPEKVNLNEGGRGRVEVHITPPRNSESHAGDYSILIKVGSSNYPGQFGGARVELTVNPYYEFTVGNLFPRHKSVSWSKQSAVAHFPITNQGNSTTNYLVMAQDDENRCKFEFQVQEDVSLAKQAEVTIKPGEERSIPLRIMPVKRNLVRIRPRQYQYSVTTQSMNEGAASRILSGTFISRPLFGLFSILMAVIILLLSAFFILRPRIMDFNVVEDVIALGDPAVLNWKVSPFTSNLRIEGVNEEITGSQNQIEVIPTKTAATYTLVAGNWLSRILRMEDIRSKPITVLAIPPAPEISTFFVDKNRIFEGDEITIKWSIANADEAYLTVDGVRTSLTPQEITSERPMTADGVRASLVPQSFNNERTVTLRNDSLIVLEAKNDSGSKFQSEFIHAQKPSILIEEFSLSETTIIKGEPVTIIWKVSGVGVENVKIAPFEEVYPLEGELTFFPEASMEFVLTIKNRDLEQIRLLPIGVLEPGAEPVPPTVEFFKVAPEEITGSGAVEFSWSISGISDRREVSSIDGVVLAGLPAQGFKSFNVSKTTSYVLTAYNGDLSSAAILEVKVNETKKNAIITIDKIVPNTAINRGDSVMVYYSVYPATKENQIADSDALGWPEISGSVVVTDGFDTCTPVDLPVHACELTLNTSEKNKKIYATYSGDDNYVRRTSEPYGVGLDVVGQTAKFSIFKFSENPLVAGQQTTISFEVAPEDPTSTFPVSGKVKVLKNDQTLCIVSLAASVSNPLAAQGECLLTFTSAATEYLNLVYEGNDIYDGKIASMPELVVNHSDTTTSLTANWTTLSVVGEPILIQISVGAKSPGTGIPTGNVVVKDKDNTSDNCTSSLDSSGKGQCYLILNRVGNPINIIGTYAGDGNYNSSESIIYQHPVTKAFTTTTISSFTPTTTTVGQESIVKYQVKVNAPGTGIPTGTVSINAGNGNLCNGPVNASGVGECAVRFTKVGVQSISATYSGDTNFYGSVGSGYSYSVTIASTKTTISTPEPSPSAVNDLVKVSFSVDLSQTSPIKPIGTARVEASTGENCLANVTDGSGFCNLMFTIEGTRTIKVIYLGTSDFATSESPSVTHIVVRASTTKITSTTLNPIVDQAVQIDFSVVAVTGGGGTPTGQVTVSSDTGETCTGTLTNGSGNCSITFTKSGTKNLTAVYQGNTEYKTSTSTPPYPISIAKASTTTVITSNLSTTKQVGESISVAVSVTANISATVTGNVTISIVGSTDARETCTLSLTAGTGSCSLTLIQMGSARQVQAVYEGTTDRFAGSPSAIVTQKVDPAPTTITIISDTPAPSNVNQAVAFTVRVRANTLDTLRPSGTFSIKVIEGVSENTICTGSLDSTTSEGTCSYTFTSQGIKSIKAEYSGSTNFLANSSVLITHTVDKSDTNTNINIATNPSILNQSISVNVTVSGVGTSGTSPSGTVDITATRTGSSPLSCVITLNSSGAGTCNITPNAVGDWTVRADYKGDSNFNTSTKSITQTVNQVATTTTVSVSPTPSVVGQQVAVNVSVAKTGPGDGTLGGSVSITAKRTGSTDKTCTISNISTGSGSCNITLDAAGDWIVTAVYSGNTDFNGSQGSANHTVNKVPTITTISTISPAPSVTGQSVTVTVTVTRSGAVGGTPTGNVAITAVRAGGGSASCSAAIVLNAGSGNCNLILPTAGEWTITAVYEGTTIFDTSSGSKAQTVNKANTTTTVTLPTTSIVVGQSFTVSVAVAASSPGSGTPTGKVVVTAKKDNVTVNCSADIDLASTLKTCTISLPSVGEWTVTGAYSGDDNFNTSSGTSTKTVAQATTTLAITTSPSSSIIGQTVNVIFDLKVVAPGSGTPTGSITATAKIKVTGTDYEVPCTGSVANGSCSFILSQLGTWKVSATYPGDSNYKNVTSSEINHTVQ
ncbi:MAG: Ig-like domain repeat protein [Anaerolineaceae bacterium]|nr:Ig-like domain repeat protein [Anaerolineaceae bacterium]